MNVDPNKTQFEPTEANPVRQHAQMAGDPSGDTLGGWLADRFSPAGKQLAKELAKPAGPNEATKNLEKKIDMAGG